MEPATALWRAVILRAIDDAVGRIDTSCLSDDEEGRDEIMRAAQNWIAEAGEGFRLICDAAGLNPDYTRRIVLRQINQERVA